MLVDNNAYQNNPLCMGAQDEIDRVENVGVRVAP